jgi:hypothetical protein
VIRSEWRYIASGSAKNRSSERSGFAGSGGGDPSRAARIQWLAHPCRPTFAAVDSEELKYACWEANRSSTSATSSLRSIVEADPESTWLLLRRWISDARTPDDAELYGPGIVVLAGVDDQWRRQVTVTAESDPRVAHCLADTLRFEPDQFDDLVGRKIVVRTWVRYQSEHSQWDFWAVDLAMAGTSRWGVEGLWALILDLVESSDDPDTLAMVGIGPVEDLVYSDWETAIDLIEREAPRSDRLRRALWSVWDLSGDDIPDDITKRIHRASNQPPGTPHRY